MRSGSAVRLPSVDNPWCGQCGRDESQGQSGAAAFRGRQREEEEGGESGQRGKDFATHPGVTPPHQRVSERAGGRADVRVRACSAVLRVWCRTTDSPGSSAGGTEGILPRNSMARSPKEFPLRGRHTYENTHTHKCACTHTKALRMNSSFMFNGKRSRGKQSSKDGQNIRFSSFKVN